MHLETDHSKGTVKIIQLHEQSIQWVEHKWGEEHGMKSRCFQFFHTQGEVVIEAQRLMSSNLREARWLIRLDAIKHRRGKQHRASGS